MFTGIIEDLGTVKAIEKIKDYKLTIESSLFVGQKTGDSISVNGVCLTISDIKPKTASFDVIEETIKKSNLPFLKTGEMVNLERALKAGDRLGGHFVAGHIDCVGRIIKIAGELKIKIPKENMKFIVSKGSVALDGVSLTIAELGSDDFTVYLIPHTTKNTILGSKKTGDYVNVEFDLLGKYALNLNKEGPANSKITEEFLRKKGFVK
ncbi:MAG: riboflavin synthase [Candidatus Omnitrophica bacterium]|nr:riboflavin synthase [Candidatus Omnitrophota bacterium]